MVVLPNDLITTRTAPGWFFYDDETDLIDNTLGTMVSGPATPPAGNGSVQISVSGTQRRNIATYQFAGTPLASITVLKFSTYNPSAGNGGGANRSGYLNFNVDFNGSDTWQHRLVFIPSDNGTVTQDNWKEWDAINGGNALWRYSGAAWPGTAITGDTPRTWSDIFTSYSGVRIRVTDPWLGIRVGEPYADGYTENIDAFKFGTAAGTVVFDFEPSCAFQTSGLTMTLSGDCQTNRTILVPNGFTLNGADHTITAVDPAGGQFLGAVVMNGGATAYVTNIAVTTSNLAGCGGGLWGILFDGASGSITNSTVSGIRRGIQSGCQEGNAIAVLNCTVLRCPTMTLAASQVTAVITGNSVSDYQKNGITAKGNVAGTITGNVVTGAGPINYIAQNGIEVWGATALVQSDTVSGNNYTPSSYTACGLLFLQASGVHASKNTLFNNETDQCNAGKGGGTFSPNP